MGEQVIIVGAGLIGCSIALRLAEAGKQVTVVDQAGPGAGASGASFGWINASFYADGDHHRLRVAGIAAYRRLMNAYPAMPVTWQSCLWFEEQGEALSAMAQALADLDYPVERIGHDAFCQMSPGVRAPDEALHFTAEGVADPAALNVALAEAAQGCGARFVLGCRVIALRDAGAGHCIVSDQGEMQADQVVIAAGTGAEALLGLPMLQRPGLLMRTQALPPLLAHVLVAPEGEIKQDAAGRIILPTAAGHQGDETTQLPQYMGCLADEALARLQALIPVPALRWTQVAKADRPVPEDGLPVIGYVAQGLYAAVMHSGVTLAAIVGELAAQELSGEISNVLGPYRPERLMS